MFRHLLKKKHSMQQLQQHQRGMFLSAHQSFMQSCSGAFSRQMSTKNDKDNDDSQSQAKMNTFATVPSRTGAILSQMETMLKRDILLSQLRKQAERYVKKERQDQQGNNQEKADNKNKQSHPALTSLFGTDKLSIFGHGGGKKKSQASKGQDRGEATKFNGDEGSQAMNKAYNERFGTGKSKLLAQWLALDTPDLINQCRELKIDLVAGENSSSLEGCNSSQIMQMMFSYLESFEAEASSKAAATQDGNHRTISETFGMQRQKQEGIWVSMSLDELKAECAKHSLSVPTKANIDESSKYTQALFEFMEDIQAEQPVLFQPKQNSATNSPRPSDYQSQLKDSWSKSGDNEMQNFLFNANRSLKQTQNDLANKYAKNYDNDKLEINSFTSQNPENAAINVPLEESLDQILHSDELLLMGEKEATRYKNLIDVPLGPMRQLKPAPEFKFMESAMSVGTQGSKAVQDSVKTISRYETFFEDSAQKEKKGAATTNIDQQIDSLLGHVALKDFAIDLANVENQSHKQLVLSRLESIKDAKIKFNPNLAFRELQSLVIQQSGQCPKLHSREFKALLEFSSQNITKLNQENTEYISNALSQIDGSAKPAQWRKLASEVPLITDLCHLSLQTQTSMPNLLKMNTFPDFLTSVLRDQLNDPKIIDQVANCVTSMIKMAQNDFIQLKTSNQEFKKTVSVIQSKVEEIHRLLMSDVGQKSSALMKGDSITSQDPRTILNRIVLLPTAPVGSRLQKVLGTSVKALVRADLEIENDLKGIFNQSERNYILARGMQVMNDKGLQNDMRTLASSQKGTGVQNVLQDVINAGYIVSGKIKQESELNNIHHLAGLLPPTVGSDTHSVNQIDFATKLSFDHIIHMRISMAQQYSNMNTLQDTRQLIDLLELQQKYAPLAVPKAHGQIQFIMKNLKNTSGRYQFSLNDLIRIQNVILVSLQRPTYLFDEILSHKDSLATAVDKPVLKIFIENIIARMMQHQVQFDHLTNSSSLMHSSFLPYTEETFLVLSKIITDLVNEGETKLPSDNIALINKILSLEKVTTKVFDSSDQAISVLSRYLSQQLEYFQMENTQKVDSWKFQDVQKQIEQLQAYDAIFKSLRAVKPLVSSEPKLLEIISKSVKQALKNLMRDINTFSVKADLDQQAKTFKKELFPLDELISTNKSILDSIVSLESPQDNQVLTSYFEQTPLPAIIDHTLKSHLNPEQAEQDHCNFFESPRANKIIKQSIQYQTWAKLERLNGPLITYFNQLLDAEVLQGQKKQDHMNLAQGFLLKIRNSRTLFGLDLARFFKLIRQLQENNLNQPEIFDTLIMNVVCNLRTLGVNLLFQVDEDSNAISIGSDSLFKEENADRFEKDRQHKQMIFDMYKEVFERSPEFFTAANRRNGMSPLGAVFAELFDQMSFDDHIKCLRMLGSLSIDNYPEEFIQKLYDNYGQEHQIQSLLSNDTKNFIQLADYWPKFLQNNDLLTELTNIDASNFSIEDQSRILQITTHKNVINPHFILNHFTQFISSTDKKLVRRYMSNFLQSISYVGFTDKINMEQITQVLRRIYKEPKQLDIDQLLNFLVTLAVSNSRYNDFDLKSKDFVEKALDFIEKEFTGTKQITIQPNVDEKTFDLFLFNQIPSPQKTYNKILDKNMPDFVSSLMNDGRKEYFKKADNASNERYKSEELGEEFHSQDDLLFNVNEVIADDDIVQDADQKHGQKRSKRKYDRNASDMKSSFDEQQYKKSRNQKLAQLAKKDNHLLLYSNVNTLDFVDINLSNVAKAWTILFHFRGKSIESMLFEEFNSIAQRNTISKTKNHEVFNQVYLKLNYESYKNNLQLEMAGSCERTGWPIDITLNHFTLNRRNQKGDERQQPTQQEAATGETELDQLFAVYFLLQEEICYNSKTRKEEPLGLQKLMLRHLSQISNYKICTIDENMATHSVDSAIAKIQDEFYPDLGQPTRHDSDRDEAARNSQEDAEVPFILQNEDDFISEEEEMDDIVDIPQNML